jgi:hypothetical protein
MLANASVWRRFILRRQRSHVRIVSGAPLRYRTGHAKTRRFCSGDERAQQFAFRSDGAKFLGVDFDALGERAWVIAAVTAALVEFGVCLGRPLAQFGDVFGAFLTTVESRGKRSASSSADRGRCRAGTSIATTAMMLSSIRATSGEVIRKYRNCLFCMKAIRPASTNLARCSLAVGREIRARKASSLAVNACPPSNAASMVARAVSPTRAATSTMFAAATMRLGTLP